MNADLQRTVSFPRAIFRNFNVHTHEMELVNKVGIYDLDERPLPNVLLDNLAWYPHILAGVLITFDLGLDAQRRLFSDPYVAYFTMMEKYGLLAPVLEEIYIRPSAAAMTLLVQDARVNPKALLLSEPEYLALIERLDPNRRIWLADENEWPDLVKRLLQTPMAQEPPTAPWAYFRIATSSDAGLTPQLLDVLAQDEEFLYRAAYLYRQRGAADAAAVIGACIKRIESPRWAFHVLRDNLVPSLEQRTRLTKVLQGNPPWLAELCTKNIWSEKGELHQGTLPLAGEAFERFYLESVKAGYAHVCIRDLHFWARGVLMPAQAGIIARIDEMSRHHRVRAA